MSEKLEKLGGYIVQGVDFPQNLDLVLGSGLKAAVDETAKTLTISTDETVLWEGEFVSGNGTNLNLSLTLSESMDNFEYIKVYVCGTKWCEVCEIKYVAAHSQNTSFDRVVPEDAGNAAIIGFRISFENDNTLNFRGGYTTSFQTAYTGEDWSYGSPIKVIGVNRKQA